MYKLLKGEKYYSIVCLKINQNALKYILTTSSLFHLKFCILSKENLICILMSMINTILENYLLKTTNNNKNEKRTKQKTKTNKNKNVIFTKTSNLLVKNSPGNKSTVKEEKKNQK